jgi:predicted transcriptional regulator
VASGTEWQKAGVTGRIVTAMVVKGMVERDASGHRSLTKKGRDALASLI